MSRWGLRAVIRPSITAFLIIAGLSAFQNCGKFHSENLTMDSSGLSSPDPGSPGMVLQADQALQTQALTVIQNKCALCHDTANNGNVTQILNVSHLIASGLVVVGDPTQGRLIGSIQDLSMPPSGTAVTATELQTVKDWVSSMHYVPAAGGAAPPPPGPVSPLPAGKTAQADPVLHKQAMDILNVNCAGCHQGITSGGITDILVLDGLVRTGLITAKDPTKGRLLGSIADGTMPKGNAARVSAADQAVLKTWINSVTIVDDVGQAKMPTRAALAATFTGVYANLIQPKCIGCHGPIKQDSGKRYDSYTLVKAGAGGIRSECQKGSMPRTPYPAATAAELQALQTWINNGSPNN
jgi:mono/diheme cytochrome c family protein